MKRLSSTRLRLAPRPPILISSSACVTFFLPSWSACRLGSELRSGPEHGFNDVLVTGAAAQVARQRPADFFLGRIRIDIEQRLGGHHHARRAEPALQAVLLLEALLQRMQL